MAPRQTARPGLRIIGRSELVTGPIRDRAVADLGFPISFELIDSIDGLARVVTRPDQCEPGDFVSHHLGHAVADAPRCVPCAHRLRERPGEVAQVELADAHHVAVRQGEVDVAVPLAQFHAGTERATG